jgi:hypothetical protein
MWVDDEGVSHTVALPDGRDRVDAALLAWLEGLGESEISSLEDELDDLQEGVFDEVENLVHLPFGDEGQALPDDRVIGSGLGQVTLPGLLDHLRGIELAWRLDAIELVVDIVDALADAA